MFNSLALFNPLIKPSYSVVLQVYLKKSFKENKNNLDWGDLKIILALALTLELALLKYNV